MEASRSFVGYGGREGQFAVGKRGGEKDAPGTWQSTRSHSGPSLHRQHRPSREEQDAHASHLQRQARSLPSSA
jgi:hypothetical protein